jgi:hypothetical protein
MNPNAIGRMTACFSVVAGIAGLGACWSAKIDLTGGDGGAAISAPGSSGSGGSGGATGAPAACFADAGLVERSRVLGDRAVVVRRCAGRAGRVLVAGRRDGRDRRHLVRLRQPQLLYRCARFRSNTVRASVPPRSPAAPPCRRTRFRLQASHRAAGSGAEVRGIRRSVTVSICRVMVRASRSMSIQRETSSLCPPPIRQSSRIPAWVSICITGDCKGPP